MDKTLPASIAIWNKNNVWINDNMVTQCYGCQILFNLFNRKHHCRNCGNIFCYECSNHLIIIPNFISDKPKEADYWNMSYYIKYLKNVKEKVCKSCFHLINEKIISHDKNIELFNNPISIDKIRELSDLDIDIKNNYFDHLRNIQYYLPNHKYTSFDNKLLDVNLLHFNQHSKYLMHAIKSFSWKSDNDNKKKTDIINAINGKKTMQCSQLYCTRTCQESLSCDDCINILYTHTDSLPSEILKYLFQIINNTPNNVILSNLPFFITLIKNNDSNKLMQTLLYNIVNISTKIIYRTFWLLTNEKELATLQQKTNINNFFVLFNDELVTQMESEYKFFSELIFNLDDPISYLSENFNKYKPITVPYDPDIVLLDVNLNNIMIKNSYTKPVIITFTTNQGIKRILFKNESIMNDVTVLNLMTLCDIILKESIDPNFYAIIYPVIPLTRNSGMIELVDNSTTIHDIIHSDKTVLQHILETNEDKIIGDVIDKYLYSLVSYTLHSYFIGLGDRHLQNIMITDDGSIFHIDFGFILGKDAYPITCGDIKLNTGILDVIGGQGSAKYEAYLNLCAHGAIVLRKYFNIFFILLCQIRTDSFNERNIEKFIMTRFQPRQNDHKIVEEIIAVIQHSNDTYSDIIRDFLHFHTQEKTVQNSFSQMIYNTYHIIKNVTTDQWSKSNIS